MNISRNFDRIDIYKAISFVILLAILIVLILASGGESGEGTISGPQSATPTSDQAPPGVSITEEAAQAVPTPDRSEEEGVPPLPESTVVLTYDVTEGLLITPDGKAVYGLSIDGQIWFPIVPMDLADQLGTPVPEIDAQGDWIVVSVDGLEQYRWDEVALIWVKEVSVSPAPTATQTEEEQAAGIPTTPAPLPETPAESGIPNLPIPTAAPGLPKTYTLQTDEFVYCIARRFNVNPDQILAMNGLTYSSIVRRGMKLKIPQTGDRFPGNASLQAHPTWHTVKAGETIYSIACEYGDVYPWAIAYANNMESPYHLTVGMELYIP
jgi:LysM repeat protein